MMLVSINVLAFMEFIAHDSDDPTQVKFLIEQAWNLADARENVAHPHFQGRVVLRQRDEERVANQLESHASNPHIDDFAGSFGPS